MADDVRDTSNPQRPGTPRPTGEPPQKPAPRGLSIGARVAIFLGVLVVIGVVIAVLATATGGGGNGQTTGAALAGWSAAAPIV